MTQSFNQRASRVGWRARFGSAVLLAVVASTPLLVFSPLADAALRLQSHRFAYICRVVVVADGPRGFRTLYDGPVKRGEFRTFHGGDSTTICIYRNRVPERCDSRLTQPQCKVDRHSNRTTLFSIR